MLHKETVSPECLQLIYDLMAIPALAPFRLVGGTALALQKGHRHSIDIDLFCSKDFNSEFILEAIEASLYPERPGNIRMYPFGFFCNLREIKTDFMYWGHSFAEDPLILDNIRMASPGEIFAMKLQAINGRRQKKDFIDIALLLEDIPLSEAIKIFEKKYPEYDSSAIIKQLAYFELAEDTPMPQIFSSLTWDQAKEKIQAAVKKYWDGEMK